MKNQNKKTKFRILSKEEISLAKGGIDHIKPLFRCSREGMNCYNLKEGPCPGESNSNMCP